jgi:hypothetical protein
MSAMDVLLEGEEDGQWRLAWGDAKVPNLGLRVACPQCSTSRRRSVSARRFRVGGLLEGRYRIGRRRPRIPAGVRGRTRELPAGCSAPRVASSFGESSPLCSVRENEFRIPEQNQGVRSV